VGSRKSVVVAGGGTVGCAVPEELTRDPAIGVVRALPEGRALTFLVRCGFQVGDRGINKSWSAPPSTWPG
jgi:hypothetical protein